MHAPAQEALRFTLLESRERWRTLMLLGADIVFETDADGRFTFIAPEHVLGHPAESLLGREAASLLAPGFEAFDPFRTDVAVRERRAWLHHKDGRAVCVLLSVMPLLASDNRSAGTRGLGRDITQHDNGDASTAAALRRAAVLDQIMWRLRQEVMAPRMMQAALVALAEALGADGAAVLDMLSTDDVPVPLHQCGVWEPGLAAPALRFLEQTGPSGGQTTTSDGQMLLGCPCQTRFGEQTGLVLCRLNRRAWDPEDVPLVATCMTLVRIILEHDAIAREIARQARTDALTGLMNRRAFLDEASRRIERLDAENTPATLLFVDIDHFKSVNDIRGHKAGDDALCAVARLLASTMRPTDLVSRLGGDEFAIWADGMDSFAAAERATMLCESGRRILAETGQAVAQPVGLSVGVATRWPGHCENLDGLIHRADQAMYEVKRAGRGSWHVSRHETP